MPYHLHTEAIYINIELKTEHSQQSHIYVLTSSVCISKLLADHSSISTVPEVITHCPPLAIDAHLHSTLILIGASHQTNVTICTVVAHIDYEGMNTFQVYTYK